MRILLDEHLPVRLANFLPEHEVSTVRKEGWDGLKNGALLSAAADSGFAVLLTNFRSMEFQQDIRRVAIAVVVLGRSVQQDRGSFATYAGNPQGY